MNCYFCQRNIGKVDFKNTKLLEKFTSRLGKIKPKKRTGLCSQHQKQLAKAVKKARFLGLLPYLKKG